MDFTSIQNNPLYGPLRTVLGVLLGLAVGKGWIPASVMDPTVLAAIATIALAAWSIYQSQTSKKTADLVTAVAVNKAVVTQAPIDGPLAAAQQKAIIADAKATVKQVPEEQITAALNLSQKVTP